MSALPPKDRGEAGLPAGSSYANIDDDTILQMLACIIGKAIPDSSVLNITEKYLLSLKTEWIEKVWTEATTAIKKTYDFLDNILGLKGPQLIPFRYFYMAFAVYFLETQRPGLPIADKVFLVREFSHPAVAPATIRACKVAKP